MMKYIALSRVIRAATEKRKKQEESHLQQRLGLSVRERLNRRYADTGSGQGRTLHQDGNPSTR